MNVRNKNDKEMLVMPNFLAIFVRTSIYLVLFSDKLMLSFLVWKCWFEDIFIVGDGYIIGYLRLELEIEIEVEVGKESRFQKL